MSWVEPDLFYGKVKFCHLGFSIGKSETVGFSKTIAACNLKIGSCRQLIKLMTRVFKVKAISIWILKLAFLRNYPATFNQILYVYLQVQGKRN